MLHCWLPLSLHLIITSFRAPILPSWSLYCWCWLLFLTLPPSTLLWGWGSHSRRWRRRDKVVKRNGRVEAVWLKLCLSWCFTMSDTLSCMLTYASSLAAQHCLLSFFGSYLIIAMVACLPTTHVVIMFPVLANVIMNIIYILDHARSSSLSLFLLLFLTCSWSYYSSLSVHEWGSTPYPLLHHQ